MTDRLNDICSKELACPVIKAFHISLLQIVCYDLIDCLA